MVSWLRMKSKNRCEYAGRQQGRAWIGINDASIEKNA
jgi:hypothetical protein